MEAGLMGEGGQPTNLSITSLLADFIFQGERVEDGLTGEDGRRLHLFITPLLSVFLLQGARV